MSSTSVAISGSTARRAPLARLRSRAWFCSRSEESAVLVEGFFSSQNVVAALTNSKNFELKVDLYWVSIRPIWKKKETLKTKWQFSRKWNGSAMIVLVGPLVRTLEAQLSSRGFPRQVLQWDSPHCWFFWWRRNRTVAHRGHPICEPPANANGDGEPPDAQRPHSEHERRRRSRMEHAQTIWGFSTRRNDLRTIFLILEEFFFPKRVSRSRWYGLSLSGTLK